MSCYLKMLASLVTCFLAASTSSAQPSLARVTQPELVKHLAIEPNPAGAANAQFNSNRSAELLGALRREYLGAVESTSVWLRPLVFDAAETVNVSVILKRYCAPLQDGTTKAQKQTSEPRIKQLSLLTGVQSSASLVELVPSGPTMPPVPPGKSPWGGGVTLATQFLGWLSDVALKSSIDAKIKDLKKQIDAAMPRTGGVLIVIGIQQSAQPDINGRYFRSVLDGNIGGAGATAKGTMEAYLTKDRLEQGVPVGFVRRNIYFWKPSAN